MELWCEFLPDIAEDMLEKGLNVNKKEIEEKL